MLFSTAWKERWNWREGRLSAIGRWLVTREAWSDRAAWFKNRIVTRPVLGSLIVIAGLFLAIEATRHRHFYWDWLKGGAEGQIIVNSPTVYTRQRLVNDRLSQTAWLQDQLRATDKDFRSTDQLYRRANIRKGVFGVRDSEQLEGASTDSQKRDEASLDAVNVVIATTPAEFRAKNLYRDEVRSEITQTQLDDRHDISGNTIYRLAFDATVLTGSRRDAIAGTKITIGHKPHRAELTSKSRKNNSGQLERTQVDLLYHTDYVKLYADWLRHMQTQVTTSVGNVAAGIVAGNSDAKIRQLLNRFLLDSICRLKLDLETPVTPGSDEEQRMKEFRCDPERLSGNERVEAIRNQRAALKLTNDQLLEHFQKREEKSRKDFDLRMRAMLAEESSFKGASERDKKERIEGHYQHARLYCRRGNLRAFPTNTLTDVSDLKILLKTPTTECPFFDSPGERLIAGALIREKVFRLRDKRGSGAVADVAQELEEQQDCLDKTNDEAFCWYAEQTAAARCLAADFYKASLNRPNPIKWKTIDYFLRLDVVGREANDCNLLVSETAYPDATVSELRYILNENTEAFAYSVTPKNFTENIATASETRDTFEFFGRYGVPGSNDAKAFFNQMLQRSSQMRAVLAHPIVVGFSSGTKDPQIIKHPLNSNRMTSVVREIEVGWVIAPRMRERTLEQIDNQYALTTVISVPSWWRTVELDIETCWLSRERLSTIRLEENGNLKICEDSATSSKKTIVRLPGAIAELSRKLGFEVLEEPYLYLGDTPTQVMEIGQPGFLMLRGARLWRSTEVTLGSQKAQKIVVLPNMDGIIAEFSCVLPQFGNGGYDKRPIQTSALVWTSEGVTTAAPVMLIWPKQDANKAFLQPPPEGPEQSPPEAQRPGAGGQQQTSAMAQQETVAGGSPQIAAGAQSTPGAQQPSGTQQQPSPGAQQRGSKEPLPPPADEIVIPSGLITWCPELYPERQVGARRVEASVPPPVAPAAVTPATPAAPISR